MLEIYLTTLNRNCTQEGIYVESTEYIHIIMINTDIEIGEALHK